MFSADYRARIFFCFQGREEHIHAFWWLLRYRISWVYFKSLHDVVSISSYVLLFLLFVCFFVREAFIHALYRSQHYRISFTSKIPIQQGCCMQWLFFLHGRKAHIHVLVTTALTDFLYVFRFLNVVAARSLFVCVCVCVSYMRSAHTCAMLIATLSKFMYVWDSIQRCYCIQRFFFHVRDAPIHGYWISTFHCCTFAWIYLCKIQYKFLLQHRQQYRSQLCCWHVGHNRTKR